MKIYTRGGDRGKTSLPGGGRVFKDHSRVEAYGTLDEANACLGVAISHIGGNKNDDLKDRLGCIQEDLFDCGSDLCRVGLTPDQFKIDESDIERLEAAIDLYMEQCPEIQYFILPGGCPASAAIFQASTVVRRGERRIVKLEKRSKTNPFVRKYINRLSDLLFVMARLLNHRDKVRETFYMKSGKVFR